METVARISRGLVAPPGVAKKGGSGPKVAEVNQQCVKDFKNRIGDLDKRRQRLLALVEFLDGDDLQAAVKRREELVRQQAELRAAPLSTLRACSWVYR